MLRRWLATCWRSVDLDPADVLAFLGCGSITAGCWRISEPLGLIVAGVLLIITAYLTVRGRPVREVERRRGA